MLRVAQRLLLPLVLGLAAVAAFVFSGRLGDLSVEASVSAPAADAEPAAPMTSVRRLPSIAESSLRDQRIELALAALPEPPSSQACTTVTIDGVPVVELRSQRNLSSGYAQLLLTGIAAIDVLGPGHRFETTALAAELPDDNGRLRGDLYLVGGGDPVLMTYNYARGFRPILATYSAFESLADALVDRGITRIDGSVIGLDARHDPERLLLGWPSELVDTGTTGVLSALQLDDGFAERPSANGGVAVLSDQPAAEAAGRLDALLTSSDVVIGADPRGLVEDDVVDDLVPLATLASPPLDQIVFQTWAVNDATAAEMTMRELGLAEQRIGSTRAGAEAVQAALARRGVELGRLPADGSGLDLGGGNDCDDLAAAMSSLTPDDIAWPLLPSNELPGVYDGMLAELSIEADIALIGGVVGDVASFTATTVDAGRRVVIASIVNRSGGPDDRDTAYHRALLEQIDTLRSAWATVSIDEGDS